MNGGALFSAGTFSAEFVNRSELLFVTFLCSPCAYVAFPPSTLVSSKGMFGSLTCDSKLVMGMFVGVYGCL